MTRLLSAIVVLLLAMPAAAQDFEMGFEAYERGDYGAALREFRPLAEQGDAWAQHNLGVMYRKGQGVPQDHVQAHMWFNLAAAQGTERAVERRDNAEQRMTPDQIAEAQKLAREWWAKHEE